MEIKTNLFEPSAFRKIVQSKKNFSVLEYVRDISVSPEMAQLEYYASEMNIRKRQLIIELEDKTGAYVQAGDMQLMIGDIEATAKIKGVGDLMKKAVSSFVTDETLVKPHYTGDGILVMEPTFKHVILEDLEDWPDGIVIEDGSFLACDDDTEMELTRRKNVSSLLLGNEGFINSTFYGNGILALESSVPREEMIEVEIKDNVLKIDGNMAVAWSPNLYFSVEKSMSTLVSSAISKEGFVNVYEGTGKVLIAPVRQNKGIRVPDK